MKNLKIQDQYNSKGIIKEFDSLEEDVEIHDTLNPKIWDENNQLLPEVEDKIYEIVDTFKKELEGYEIDLEVDDIYILGSNANYNYTDKSDLDIHIIADESFDCSEEHLAIMYNMYKVLFNKKYDITLNGINAEVYVENKDKLSNVSAGIYSLKNGWIKKPALIKIPKVNELELSKNITKWEGRYLDLIDDPNTTIKQIDKFFDDIYDMRKSSIMKDGEFGIGNLTFKELRNLNYLDDLKELKDKLTSQELSLD